MINYAVCIFLSAFLLFQIQPIISKTLLPWFGGTPAVWSSAMLFFQIALTGGYAYSNWLVGRNHPKKQTIIHLVLIGISICLVIFLWVIWPSPVTPSADWKPVNISSPFLTIIMLLTVSVGLPFFVLSTNSPLMQAWFSRKNPGRSPYWLYALSNIGSILGLMAYPVVIEPSLTLQWQGWLWAGGYLVFAGFAVINAVLSLRGNEKIEVIEQARPEQGKRPGIWQQFLWILLSTCASLMVLAVTSQTTQEVAVIPFLWVLPLTIYLLSFVLAFSSKRWYHRGIYSLLLFIATMAWFVVIINPLSDVILQIIIYNFLLFSITMICNGELYALRPQASGLTHFYLMGSIGGAIGGLFVNLLAPILFRSYLELFFGLGMVWILLAVVSARRSGAGFVQGLVVAGMAVAVSVLVIFLMFNSTRGNLFIERNFYGVVRVKEVQIGKDQHLANVLVHGSTNHGFEFLEAGLRDTPTSYYSANSGVGLAIVSNPHYGAKMHVGVLGLGIGTLAAYGQPGDEYRFYEINPVMVSLANGQGGYFSFVKDSPATVKIVVGDARISLEQETKAGVVNNFDVLVLDTFSSDSIPVHLVTVQAFDIYLNNLAQDGVIAANISNRVLDLRPVFWQVAQYHHLNMAIIYSQTEAGNPAAVPAAWVLLTRNKQLLDAPALAGKLAPLSGFRTDTRPWTDDYSNLIQILK